MFILVGSTVFSLVFRGMDGDLWVEHLLTSVPGGVLGFLIVVNVMIFLLAFFLDYFEIAFIMVPLLAPVAQKLGIDLVWFGVLLAINMQTSFLHPPFGFALFYLRSVAPKSVRTTEIYWGAIPFVLIQILMVAIVIAFPRIVTGNISRGARRDQGLGRRGAAAPDRRTVTRHGVRRRDRRRGGDAARRRPSGEAPEDAGAELERLLKGQ